MKRQFLLRFVLISTLLIAAPFLSALLFAQNVQEDSWQKLEKGISYFDQGQLGDALEQFRLIAAEDPSYANVHMWIGHIFLLEGELEAARSKYEDALESRRNFFPDSKKIEAYYSLAEVNRQLADDEQMEKYLQKILQEGRTEELPESRIEAMMEKFIQEGPDKLLELYRLRDKAVREAYLRLGELALRDSRYETALKYLLLSLTTSFSLAIDAERILNPEYEFMLRDLNPGLETFFTENTALLLERVQEQPKVARYFQSVGIFRQLFLTGMALQGMDEPEKARQIWLLITDHRDAGLWFEFAQEQLGTPDLEKIPLVLQYR